MKSFRHSPIYNILHSLYNIIRIATQRILEAVRKIIIVGPDNKRVLECAYRDKQRREVGTLKLKHLFAHIIRVETININPRVYRIITSFKGLGKGGNRTGRNISSNLRGNHYLACAIGRGVQCAVQVINQQASDQHKDYVYQGKHRTTRWCIIVVSHIYPTIVILIFKNSLGS